LGHRVKSITQNAFGLYKYKPKIREILEINYCAIIYATRGGTPQHCQLEWWQMVSLIALVGRLWKKSFPVLFRTTTTTTELPKTFV
jgi:hypothetical protein